MVDKDEEFLRTFSRKVAAETCEKKFESLAEEIAQTARTGGFLDAHTTKWRARKAVSYEQGHRELLSQIHLNGRWTEYASKITENKELEAALTKMTHRWGREPEEAYRRLRNYHAFLEP